MENNESLFKKEDLEKMPPEEIAKYKVALEKIAFDSQRLIKKCDEILKSSQD